MYSGEIRDKKWTHKTHSHTDRSTQPHIITTRTSQLLNVYDAYQRRRIKMSYNNTAATD